MRITCKLILLIPILIVTSASCAPIKEAEAWVRHSSWSADARPVRSPQQHRGIFVGLVRPEDRDAPISQRPSITQFMVGDTGVFTPLLLLGTGDGQPYPVLVSAFLDYEQVSFSLDGRDGRLHYVQVPPGVDLEIPLAIPVQSRGWHDFFVVVFGEPENQTVDPNERLPGSSPVVGGVRTVICAGDCSSKPHALPAPYEGRPGGQRGGSAFLAALPLLPDPTVVPQRRLLQVAHGQPGQPFALELWALNETDQKMDYVVLPLLDYRQISLDAAKVLPFSMPAGTELFVPGRVELPRERGLHELQVVYIFNPYEAIDRNVDPFVHCITRAALLIDQ